MDDFAGGEDKTSAGDGLPSINTRLSAGDFFASPAAAKSTLEIGQSISGRYEILSCLGEGGMGAVYKVRDRALDRIVALKVIRPELGASDEILQRFKQELIVARQVTHRNVVRIFDLGEEAGFQFITMEFIEGESLSSLLKRGPLPIKEAVEIMTQVCSGLEAAHAEGIVHRDLKPANVMRDQKGRVVLMDFGLARSLAGDGMTQTGVMLGTLEYMSPEQARGEHVDCRSDLYTFGLILYEMLTKQRPFQAESAISSLMKRSMERPSPPEILNPQIPRALSDVVMRCLEPKPEMRYQNVSELKNALEAWESTGLSSAAAIRRIARRVRPAHRRIAVGAVFVVLLATVGILSWEAKVRTKRPQEAGLASVPLVGVAKFENQTGDKSLDSSTDSLSRLITDGLTGSKYIGVVGAERVQPLKLASADESAFLKSAANDGISYLLTGELVPVGGAFSLATRVINTKTGATVSSSKIDNLTRQNVLSAAAQAAMAVKKGLNLPTVEAVDTYAGDFASNNSEAYDLYVAGLQQLSSYHYRSAEKFLSDALKKAPDFAMARYRLANLKAATGRTDEALDDAKLAVTQSANLPERENLYIRAGEAYLARRWDEAVKLYQQIIDKYPYDLEPRQTLAQLYVEQGEYQKAIDQAKVMAQIDPRNHSGWSALGLAHLGLHDFNAAISDFRKYVELEPGSANAYHLLGDAYRSQSEFDLAAEQYKKALNSNPEFHFSTVSLAETEVLRGRYAAAEQLLGPLVADNNVLPLHRIDAAFDLAWVLRAQGRFREAALPLEKIQPQLVAEKIRLAMALSVRGLCAMESGDMSRAKVLIDEALSKSPTVPTRYLFARGLLELRQRRFEQVRQTAAEIAKNGVPEDRTEDKAAAYLRGLAALGEAKSDAAREQLTEAVGFTGYEYAIYRLGLARAYLSAGGYPEALSNTKQAAAPLDPITPRLDLELDRVRALLATAQSESALKRSNEASESAKKFLEIWVHADPNLQDVVEARKLLLR